MLGMLLDTHAWIWAVDGPGKLGTKTRRRLTKASGTTSNALSISTASVFEVAALHTAGRLQFSLPVERWIREAIGRAGVRVIDLETDIAVDAGMIPSSALPDPFDRCLVATAREYGIPLVTCDRLILDYARRTRLVTVIDGTT